MSLVFDQLYNRVKQHLKGTFDVSFIGFSKLGVEIDVDEAIDYINNIIEEVEKKDDDNKTHSDYLTLAFCYFALSIVVKQDEELYEDEEVENGN